jgi:CheY-like chemotaxis protein
MIEFDLYAVMESMRLYELMRVERQTLQILRRIADHVCENDVRLREIHPYFTLHDRVHCAGVAATLDRLCTASKLLEEDAPHRITPLEAFVLLASACLHDVGMYVFDIDTLNSQTGRKMSDVEIASYVRERHPWLSATHVYEHGMNWGMNEEYLRRCVASVCLAHSSKVNISEFPVIGSAPLRTSALGKLLRIADVLDIEFSRAPDELRRQLFRSGGEKIGLLHWMKHHYVLSVQLLFDETQGHLVVRPQVGAPTEDLLDAVSDVVAWTIEREIRSFDGSIPELGLKIEFFPCQKAPKDSCTYLCNKVTGDDLRSLLPRPDLSALIVDDDETWCEIIRERLAEMAEGHNMAVTRIEAAGDIITAQQMLRQNNYNLVVLDVLIPKKKGVTAPDAGEAIQFSDEIARSSSHYTIVGVTGLASRADAVALMRTGVADIVDKALDGREFTERIWKRVQSLKGPIL